MLLRVITTIVLLVLSLNPRAENVQAEKINKGVAFAQLGEPKYSAEFSHFDYVFPDAPKTGAVTLAAAGTFDNFNRYALRGSAAVRTEQLYDTLFTTSEDEASSYYPLIAQSARYPDDYRWIEIAINPLARFHDGSAITSDDVVFTFKKFMAEGVPQFRMTYAGIEAKTVSALTVRFELPQPDKNKILGLMSLPILPAHFWKHHKLSDPLTTPPLSSGPYRISDYRMGQQVTYQHVRDYWAASLPVNIGRYNFDTLRYDYYLDDKVALEAFKAGAYDVRTENSPKNWMTQYQDGNFARNYIVKQDLPDNSAQNTRWLVFNIQRPVFADRRVRQAVTLAFDFDWMNKVFYYNSYQRTNSFFQNTDYAASGQPDAAELSWLEPVKHQIPLEIFSQIYYPPNTDGSGSNRENLLRAKTLLQQAGWEIKNKRLVNSKTGDPFIFELLLQSGSNFQYVLPFQHSLQRLGITMTIRTVDSSQFINRLRKRDFDMLPNVYPAFPFPAPNLRLWWSSAYITSSYNSSGIQDPAVDTLINDIIRHQGEPSALRSLGRALDRVLTWSTLMIPMWYTKNIHIAYWDKFSMPAVRPVYSLGFDSWWFDARKAARLPEDSH